MATKIGIIGGSGFYQFFKGKEVTVKTPYGNPSDKILISTHQGSQIAFLPRHGKQHQYPPHKINYKANLFALNKLGFRKIISPSAAGSLKPEIKPGHMVICDQFIDKTKAGNDTFFDGPKVVHISVAESYCPALRKLAIKSCQKTKIVHHPKGTVLVIEGPRFATRAESKHYATMADIINMTQYPEVALARELQMCYLNISLITDYDSGLVGVKGIKPSTTQTIIKTFKKNDQKLKKLILQMIENFPEQAKCQCSQSLKEAAL
ncbi:MAG: S-methyl-5'-thioadenosine phosphorylase [Patescibacteria group bacterium]